ncbi:MAG: DHA2 family efflux MFS transporter permease subunit [Chloroflexi bacterium]|nr:DHA2 family efflux MFS transporter permease subunit [Chloroflexota bacterium]
MPENIEKSPQFSTVPPAPDDGYKWRALGIIMIGTFMAVLDSSIVNVAMPHMMASFGTDLDKMKWVATVYMISYGVIVLISDFIGKRFGHERLYIAALGLFTIGSFMCGRAWDINSMIAFRAFQAVGGGLMLPTGMTIITRAFKPSERGAAFGTFGMVILLAPVLGPTLGGYLVDSIGWPSIFLINIPVGIIGILMSVSVLRLSPKGESRPFDWAGFLGLSTALTTFLLALSQGERWGWDSPATVTCFSLAGAGFFVFVVSDLYAKHPIIDLSLFSDLPFTLLSIMSFLRAVALFGRTLFLSLFMQTLMGYSAFQAGVYLIPGAIVAGFSTPIAGRLADRFGAKPLILPGFLITAWSLWLYRDIAPNSPYSAILWPMLLLGIGMGMLSSPMMSSAMNVVEPRHVGTVSMLQTVLMQVGGAYGINYMETLVNSRTTFHFQSQLEAFTGSIANHAGRWVPGIMNISKGADAVRSLGISMYNQNMAAAWAYNDAFIIMAWLCVAGLVVGLFFHEGNRKPEKSGRHEPGAVEAG